MPRIDPVEAISGLLVLALGAFFFFGSMGYPMGTIGRMGPGFVPHWLGAISMFLGAVILLSSLRIDEPAPDLYWRPLVAVLASIGAFALLLPRIGLVGAALVTAAISILGNRDAGWRMLAITSVSVALICWVLFVLLLRLPIPAFWWDL
ncbi:tripartite tricarboxylate transporter TctB family protein [Alterinioella nitratireducens]|uniref:tripartite tricarboxylate transporter TctB family protein n=1 Tax=Alterinioella nitratireducens TaxID=2735915 RepID=UPI001551C25E|nr:tripartite tricarboxylate transporter TctB family protein [Alterinioella nitratireducens]NPD21242.1 tripartite tricarboxylate transporter TctB family protein [Alterinioella nitratireducens]